MAWSYTGDPADSDKDRVRFLIGDTDTSDQQLQDAEILDLLTEAPNPLRAAANAAEAIAAKYSRQVDKSLGQSSVSASRRAVAYQELADSLRKRARRAGVTPFAGGRSKAAKDAAAESTDAVQPSFSIGQDDLPPSSLNDLTRVRGGG